MTNPGLRAVFGRLQRDNVIQADELYARELKKGRKRRAK
jgi:hypothetical protein